MYVRTHMYTYIHTFSKILTVSEFSNVNFSSFDPKEPAGSAHSSGEGERTISRNSHKRWGYETYLKCTATLL